MSSVWWEVVGWVGSGVLVLSLLQSRVLRLRQLNLVASVLLVAYNGVLQIWPMVAMNVAISAINIGHLARLLRGRHDPAVYSVVEVDPGDRYLRHVLDHHRGDIERFTPALAWDPDRPGSLAFLVLRDTEMVGVVLAHEAGDGVAQVELDYVVPRFRNFTPGEFVYRSSGLFTSRGFHRVVAPRSMRRADRYLHDIGFVERDGDRVLDLVADVPNGDGVPTGDGGEAGDAQRSS